MISNELTWTCHVCGAERPDEKISVYSSEKEFGDTGVMITQNVRYCNDNPNCIAGARDVKFVEEAADRLTTVETANRVVDVEPDLITRWRWRAERRCRRLNAERRVPFYRWEVHDWLDGRWAVVAMQNVGQIESH